MNMKLSYGLYMAEAEGYLQTPDKAAEDIAAEVKAMKEDGMSINACVVFATEKMRRYRETTGKSFSEDDINTIENSI
jgi:hypothetical protein